LLLALIAVIQRWSFGLASPPVLAIIIYAFQLAKGAGIRHPDSVQFPSLSGFIYGSVIMIKHLSSARLILGHLFLFSCPAAQRAAALAYTADEQCLKV